MLLEGKTTIDTGQFEAKGRLRIHGFEVATFAEGKRSNLGIEHAHFATTMCVCLIHRPVRASLTNQVFVEWNFYLRIIARKYLVDRFFGEKVRAAKIFSVE